MIKRKEDEALDSKIEELAKSISKMSEEESKVKLVALRSLEWVMGYRQNFPPT
jgi:hypothetical protein